MQEGYLQEKMGYWQYLSENPINSLFEDGLVHLWFIPALICAVIVIAFFIRFNKFLVRDTIMGLRYFYFIT